MIGIGAFACAFGDVEAKPEDIAGFDEIWRAESDADFATMGCGTFCRMTAPVHEDVVDCVRRTLAERDVSAGEVDRLVIATTDTCLARLAPDFAVQVLDGVGLTGCVPALVSLQQCCGSVTSLQLARDLFSDPAVRHVLLVSVDFTPDDRDRVRPFAFFGDAVASCLLSRSGEGELRLVSSAIRVDPAGLRGEDSFVSRQMVAQDAYAAALGGGNSTLADVAKVFPTNLFKPLTLFSTSVAGVPRDKLHFTDTLRAYAHCGNCDWMINLHDYRQSTGIRSNETYLVQASAPGFFACAVLAGV